MAWGNKDNLLPELAQLNRLLAGHPCFFDGAKITRLSPAEAPVLALLRESAEGEDRVLVLVNTDIEHEHALVLPGGKQREPGAWKLDLLGQALPSMKPVKADEVSISLAPGAAYCLSPAKQPHGLSGDAYRHARAASRRGRFRH